MPRNILLLGGTADALALAEALTLAGHAVTYSLAGVTAAPRLPACPVRRGGFGGVDGLAEALADFDVLIDATHPFAAQMSAQARAAAELTGVPRLQLLRPAWELRPGWQGFDSAADLATALPRHGQRAFLTVGPKLLPAFAAVPEMWFLVRLLSDQPVPLPRHQVLLGSGGAVEEEAALMAEHRIDVLVTKASGGNPAKLEAAARLGLPVLLLNRPAAEPGPVAGSVAAALAWVQKL